VAASHDPDDHDLLRHLRCRRVLRRGAERRHPLGGRDLRDGARDDREVDGDRGRPGRRGSRRRDVREDSDLPGGRDGVHCLDRPRPSGPVRRAGPREVDGAIRPSRGRAEVLALRGAEAIVARNGPTGKIPRRSCWATRTTTGRSTRSRCSIARRSRPPATTCGRPGKTAASRTCSGRAARRCFGALRSIELDVVAVDPDVLIGVSGNRCCVDPAGVTWHDQTRRDSHGQEVGAITGTAA